MMTWNMAWLTILREMKRQKVDFYAVKLTDVMKAVNKLYRMENKPPELRQAAASLQNRDVRRTKSARSLSHRVKSA